MADKSSSGVTAIGVSGIALAMIVSFDRWHSIGWAIAHGVCGWGYVLYVLGERYVW